MAYYKPAMCWNDPDFRKMTQIQLLQVIKILNSSQVSIRRAMHGDRIGYSEGSALESEIHDVSFRMYLELSARLSRGNHELEAVMYWPSRDEWREEAASPE